MDAFTHAFEAFCAPGSHPMCDAIALGAMRKIRDRLPTDIDTSVPFGLLLKSQTD